MSVPACRHVARPAPSGKGSCALRASISPSISKGRTEVEPSCSASALSNRLDRRRNRAARLLPRHRFAAAPLAPGAGTSRPRRGASKHGVDLVSFCACPGPTVVPQRQHLVCHRRATRWPPSLSRQQNLSSFQRWACLCNPLHRANTRSSGPPCSTPDRRSQRG